VARLEQRHALLLRQLSGFLADASLAVDANASLQEVLQLVTEHALDVVEADACTARLAANGAGAVLEAEARASTVGPDASVRERLTELYAELRPGGGSIRLDPAAVAERVPGAEVAWLAAPFTALDGRVVGLTQLFSLTGDRPFSTIDEAVTVQLAQMASATFERMHLYRR
jgi:GAF domain-containing protein